MRVILLHDVVFSHQVLFLLNTFRGIRSEENRAIREKLMVSIDMSEVAFL